MAQQEQEVQLALLDHRKVLEALERAYLVEDIALVGQDLAQLGVDMDHQEEEEMEQAVQGALKDTFLLVEVQMAYWKRMYLVAVQLAP